MSKMIEERELDDDGSARNADGVASFPASGSGTREAARHVDAVASALDLLDCFDDQDALSVGEFSGVTGINRSRVMRLAGTLESRGYLIFDPESRRYRLGHRLLALGRRFSDSLDVVNFSRPHLDELSRETGETASLFAIDGLHRIVLALADGHFEVRHALAVGDRKVLHAGASGKVLLAHCAQDFRDIVIRQAMASSDAAGRDPEDLRAELAVVAAKGFAISHGERIADAAAIAAPVFNSNGSIAASLGISGATSRFTDAFVAEALPRVREHAEALSRRLGWRGPAGEAAREIRPGG